MSNTDTQPHGSDVPLHEHKGARNYLTPKWNPQISLGSIISWLGMIFVLGGIWSGVGRDLETVKEKQKTIDARVDKIDDSGTRASQRKTDQEGDAIKSLDRRVAAVEEQQTFVNRSFGELKSSVEVTRNNVEWLVRKQTEIERKGQ